MPVNSISQFASTRAAVREIARSRAAVRKIARCAALALSGVLLCVAAPAQQPLHLSQLPATAPTANTLPAPIAATPVPQADAVPRHRARVTYNSGLLNVEANNSSLNGILRDIAMVTGMKITGGVADQRVFGNYGPAEPSTILATLLDGTGSNMLLRETAGNGPAELILTPRGGGASPPSPSNYNGDLDLSGDAETIPPHPAPVNSGNAANPNAGDRDADQIPPSGPRPIPQPLNNVLGSPNNTTPTASSIPTVQSVPTDSISTPSTAQPVSGIVDSTNPPPAGSTGFGSMTPTQPAADAPKTPEQIYQQLQALQAAHQKAQGSGSSNSTTQPSPASTPQ
ncbi:MAG TPA: hypothetical protein VGN16_13110 [Acidobacteriaceae bacterium]|jgi:hypothetical protein